MTKRKERKLERRLRELQRRYKDNVYKIDERFCIVRVSGRRPHKIKEKK